MKIKSKGYTLVELLISMAIFAVVMIGIFSIMRTASVSFKNESIEVSLQEESQILLSQVEELLVDCHKCVPVSNGYKIQLSNNASDNIWLRYHDNALYYSETESGANEELIASGVEKFTIDELVQTNGDNLVIVKTKLTKNAGDKPFSYESSKNVIFRNNVEGDPDRDDSLSSHFINNTPAGGGGGGANERTLYVGRYQVVDLQQLYGITSVSSITDSDNAYSFINPNSVNSDTGGIDSYTTQAAPSIYLTTSATVNSSLDAQYNADIVGTAGSETLTVHLITKACGFQHGTGLVEFPDKSVNDGNNKGFFSYVTFDGFCFADYLKYNSGSSISASIAFPDDATAKTGTLKSAYYDNSFGSFNYQYNIGLNYDMFESDKLVVRFQNGHNGSSASNLMNADKKIKLSVTLPGNTTPYTDTYYAVSAGSNLTNVN